MLCLFRCCCSSGINGLSLPLFLCSQYLSIKSLQLRTLLVSQGSMADGHGNDKQALAAKRNEYAALMEF